MAFYKTCPICNASLDPQESCDCRNEQQASQRTAIMGTTIRSPSQTAVVRPDRNRGNTVALAPGRRFMGR